MSQTIAAVAGHEPNISQARTSFWGLTLGSIGVVYGDIGTSPLYAMRESVLAAVGPNAPASEPVVLGILSLIIWALIISGYRQIRSDPVACGQQWGGRHAGADGAGFAGARAQQWDSCPARNHQRRIVLRRCHHHTGAVSLVG